MDDTIDLKYDPDSKFWTFEEYMELAKRTAQTYENKDITLAVLGMGLAGESGELTDLLKKVVGHGHQLDLKHVTKELGDVLWYWSELCRFFDLNPSDVAAANIEKLKARYGDRFSEEASKNRKAEDI